MKISDLGEWSLIDMIFKIIRKNEKIALPYGDDAVAIPFKNQILVINTDMLVESTDIPPGMTMKQVGNKTVVMCISDLVAKGAKPIGLMFALGLPSKMRIEEFQQLINGLNDSANKYDTYILGGDINEAKELIIAGTAIGITKRVVSRNGAKIGDIVAVTGEFGNTAAGLKILLDKIKVPRKLEREILKSVYEPEIKLKEILTLINSRAISASIDSSDGLATSLHEIAEKSKVGFKIWKMPISKIATKFAEITGIDPFELTFYGGEEYHLIVTIQREKIEEVMKTTRKIGGKIIPIGKVIKERKIIFVGKKEERIIEKRGWEHFKLKIHGEEDS